MWKIWNWLFGWEYVTIENSAESLVRRIWWRGDGMPMISAYCTQIWPLIPPYHGWKVTPITSGAVEIIRTIEADAASSQAQVKARSTSLHAE